MTLIFLNGDLGVRCESIISIKCLLVSRHLIYLLAFRSCLAFASMSDIIFRIQFAD